MFKGLPSVVGSEFWAVQLYITEYFRHFDNMNAGWDASQTLGTLDEIFHICVFLNSLVLN